jgi:hypothetical protein
MAQHALFGNEAIVAAAANAPVSSAQAQAAKRELVAMRASLTKWLHYRRLNSHMAGGVSVVPDAAFKRPGAKRLPPAVLTLRLAAGRKRPEAELAMQLHQLLSEVFDASELPSPDTEKNPDAAAVLAMIAISGKLPGEAPSSAVGFIWMWPVVIVVGALAYVISTAIRSSAEQAAERERYECIKSGACTDYGFWLKLGAVAFIGWIAWEKFGGGVRVKRALNRGSR